MSYKIIDISTHQKNVNWAKVKASGVKGVILRAGYGRELNQKDEMFESHYAGAKSVGLPVGAYHFSYAKSVSEVLKEADCMLEWIKGKQFELPIYYDAEINGINTDMCIAYCDKLEKSGYYTGVYASKSWFTNILDYNRLTRFTIWVAQYYSECTLGKPHQAWQYTSTGRIDGIEGNVDINAFYEDYPTIIKKAGLNGFAKGQSPTPIPKPPVPSKRKYKVGDKIRFSTCYKSSTDPIDKHIDAKNMARDTGTITKIVNARNPYLLDNGLCWVNDGDIREVLSSKSNLKSIDTIAREVIAGNWGNNPERAERLRKAGYNSDEIQKKVNELL